MKKKDMWVNLADLEEVIGTYGIRRDVRANAAIKNLAVEGQIFRWTSVDEDLPENGKEVLATVNMRTSDGLQMGAIEKASFVREVGWILHGHLDAEFDVVKWAELPR
jgi:hypothetical protein